MTFAKSPFFKRSVTTVIGLPLVLLFVWLGGFPLLVACALIAILALREFYLAFSKKDRPIHFIGYLATIGYFGALFFLGAGYFFIALALFIITVQICLVTFFKNLPISECIPIVYGVLYVPFLFSFILLVREHPLGDYYIWLIFISSFGCDTFAYLTGSLFGKNKLKNTPSPSKSYEGLAGGIIGATAIGIIYGVIVSRLTTDYSIAESIALISALISFFGAIFSIIGDLAASAVKRRCQVKDFGKIFPGHGGFMDRIDSLLTVAPVVYIVMVVMLA